MKLFPSARITHEDRLIPSVHTLAALTLYQINTVNSWPLKAPASEAVYPLVQEVEPSYFVLVPPSPIPGCPSVTALCVPLRPLPLISKATGPDSSLRGQ